jgi:hypothetical protein
MRGREGRYLSVSKIEHHNFGVILWHVRFFLLESFVGFSTTLPVCVLSRLRILQPIE